VRTPQGVVVDPTGKLAGRGAYLHDQRSCWQAGLKGPLAHALKVELADADKERLLAFISTLPEDSALKKAGDSQKGGKSGDAELLMNV
jgi:predicted RNA-binding protein YlxR (DUF448 family)